MTTMPVAVVVNGEALATIPAMRKVDPVPGSLPPLPWSVQARSAGGRVLATLIVSPQDAVSATSGVFAREDLACGRLDLYAGPEPLGPAFSPDLSKPCD